ncbi:MAG: rRNA maturation RNase YbeY [Parvularculaceae bacterium]
MSGDDDRVEVRIDAEGWRVVDPAALAQRCFAAVERAERDVKWPVSLVFTDDASVQRLNAQFRGRDNATNVLSFPPGDAPVAEHDYLGDIALAFETCAREATAKNIPLGDHAAHLIVHGVLHLIGYDHEDDDEAEEMERRESEILVTLGVADPYGPEAE